MPKKSYVINMGNENKELLMMKMQLKDMIQNPQKYEKAIASGYVCAGFGGDLNGVHVPETFMSGKLPAGTTPQQALQQVIQFMAQTIKKAEEDQKVQNIGNSSIKLN